MNNIHYPAFFHKAEEGGYWVEFPDLPGCVTQGEDMDEAYKMAVEAMGLYLEDLVDDEEKLPRASSLDDIEVQPGFTIVMIPFDYLEYKRTYRKKAVKKTLSIPEWLNDLALKENVNFSQVLQDALIEKLVTSKNL